jgi:dihydropteroate synthase
MHMRGTPATMTGHAQYDDVAHEVVCELAERVNAAEQAGIARANIMIDPGIGFAKTPAQSRELLRRLPLLLNLGCRVLVGVSRKSSVSTMIRGVLPTAQSLDSAMTPPPGPLLEGEEESGREGAPVSHESTDWAAGINPSDRLPGSLAAGLFALSRGASMLRVHDVGATVQAMRIWQALRDDAET